VIFTKIAWLGGLVVLALLCWLAVRGLTMVVPFLVTGVVLVVLIGGGNLIHGRTPERERDPGDPPGRDG